MVLQSESPCLHQFSAVIAPREPTVRKAATPSPSLPAYTFPAPGTTAERAAATPGLFLEGESREELISLRILSLSAIA